MSAPTLPIECVTRCGYCGQHCVMHAVDDWRCARCAPELARIKTVDEWGSWMQRERRVRRRGPVLFEVGV